MRSIRKNPLDSIRPEAEKTGQELSQQIRERTSGLRLPRPARRTPDPMNVAVPLAAFSALIGAAAAYLLDPERGRARRARLRAELATTGRDMSRQFQQTSRYVSATAAGKSRGLAASLRSETHEPPNDAELAHRVETELFRDPEVPKGRININAEHGVVVLRGGVDSDAQLRQLEEQARKIEGVREVRNLLQTRTNGAAAPETAQA
jgi:BON domain